MGALVLGSVSLQGTGCSPSKARADAPEIATGGGDAGSVETTEEVQPVEAAGARTFRLEPQGERCEWRVQDVATGTDRSIYSTETCPEQVIWQEGQVYLTQGSSLFRVTDVDSDPARIDGPSDSDCIDWGVPVMTEGSLKWACGMPAHGGEEGLLCVGEECHSADDFSPSWGSPYLVRVYAFEGEQWSKVDTFKTCSEAGGCWGVAHKTGPPSEDWQHLTWLGERQTSAGEQCGPDIETGIDSRPGTVHSSYVRSLFGLSATPEQDEFGACLSAVQVAPSDWLIYPVAWGDTAHAMKPVYRCTEACSRLEDYSTMEQVSGLPASLGDQVSIRPIAVDPDGLGYVIVSPEYPDAEGFDAWVIGEVGAREVSQYSGVLGVVWLDGIRAPFE
jgi:hypothetical protein